LVVEARADEADDSNLVDARAEADDSNLQCVDRKVAFDDKRSIPCVTKIELRKSVTQR